MSYDEFKNICALYKFDKGLILIVSHDSSDKKHFQRIFDRILSVCNVEREFFDNITQ